MKEDMRRTAGPKVPAHSKGIQVHVEEHVRQKMQGWCNAANGEVSGWFQVKLDKGIFHVYNVFLPQQFGSTGYTKMVHGASSLYFYFKKLCTNQITGEFDFEKYADMCADLKGWWHTHYNFGVFWSGTDDNQAQANAELAEDWSLSIVINQKGDWLARVDVVSPIPVMLDELPIKFVPNTKKASKRDYAWDIKRWVSPFPERKVFVWKKKEPQYKPIAHVDGYINYGGHLIPKEEFMQIVNCACGDMTCSVCLDTIKTIKKGVEADEAQDEMINLIANGRVDA